MYGSGSCGITADNVKGLKCIKSVIHGCTHEGFYLRNSSNIEFDECDIFNNDFYNLFDINNCMNITMNSCKIKNNHPAYLNDENDLDPNCGTSGYFFLFDISESMSVTVKNCKIQNNFACFLMNKSNAAAFENTTIENNEFSFIPSSDNTSSDVPSSDATSSGSSSNCDQFFSDYEEFVDSYIAILKKQKANPTDASIMAEYSQIMSKSAAMQKDSKACAGNPEFAARIAKIAAKMAAAASGM
jgi:parallel beta-helix repeat protein